MLPAETMLAAGGMLLNLFVLPTVLDQNAQVPRTQSIPYAVTLAVFMTIPYTVLGLLLPAVATGLGAILWAFVALYRNT